LTLDGSSGNVLCLAFDGGGTRLASAAWDGTVSVWDAADGKLLRKIAAHSAPAHAVAFGPDGTRLFSVGWDRLGKVWDPETGELIHTLEGHRDQLLSVALSRDGTILATGSEDRVMLWDATTYVPIGTLETSGAGLLAFTPDGQTLLAAACRHKGDDTWSFSRWNVKTRQRRATRPLPGRGGLLVAHLGIDGRTVFAMSCDPPSPRVGVYDAETGKEIAFSARP
jgi:WD40 repeat protein